MATTRKRTTKSRYQKVYFPLSIIIFGASIFGLLFAATPSPGHPWVEVGDAWWVATGTTAYRTFTFPDATSTVLTTNSPVTVAQGGIGTTSTSTALNVLTGLTTKGDMFLHTGTINSRLPVGTNNYALTADSAGSVGATWSQVTVIPGGLDTNVQFNNGGVFGATTSLRFDSANQALGINGKIDILTQNDPSPPVTDTLRLYAKKISGRSMLKGVGPFGVDYVYQPSFFQNAIFMLLTGGGTAYTVIGNVASSTGTISHVVSEPLGYMANQVTATAASSTAGTFASTTQFYRGAQVGSNGFFFQARMAFVTATSSGLYAFVGFTDGPGMRTVSGPNPAGSHVGFQYSTVRGDTGWKFMTKDGTTQNVSATVLPFGVNTVMDFFIYCPPYPNNGTIYYRIDNVSSSTTAEGSTATNLPAGGTLLRPGFAIGNTTVTGARNVRVSRLYVESDR